MSRRRLSRHAKNNARRFIRTSQKPVGDKACADGRLRCRSGSRTQELRHLRITLDVSLSKSLAGIQPTQQFSKPINLTISPFFDEQFFGALLSDFKRFLQEKRETEGYITNRYLGHLFCALVHDAYIKHKAAETADDYFDEIWEAYSRKMRVLGEPID